MVCQQLLDPLGEPCRGVEASRAHVLGYSDARPRVTPLAHLTERLIDDPVGERCDEATPLGKRYELGRRDETSVALPAHQCLALVQLVPGGPDDGLVMQLQLTVRQCGPKRGERLEPAPVL